MTIISNFMTRPLIVRRPSTGARPVILAPRGETSGDVVIPPGGSARVDFWDRIKNHPVYQSLLDRRKIGVGEDDPEAREDFTSAGDTLKAPERLDPETMKREAGAEGVKDLSYENEPQISTKRKRGRKARLEENAESAAGEESPAGT